MPIASTPFKTLNGLIDNGTLPSTPRAKRTIAVKNKLEIPVRIFLLSDLANPVESIGPGNTNTLRDVNNDLLVLDKNTGAFVGVVSLADSASADNELSIKPDLFTTSDTALATGPFSTPRFVNGVPAAPTWVIVGEGSKGKIQIIEYLYWREVDGGVNVPQGSTGVTLSISRTTGTTLTESEARSVSRELGFEVSATVGVSFMSAFSLELSATMSQSITTTTSFTRTFSVTQQTTETQSVTFPGSATSDVVFHRFQLRQVFIGWKDGAQKFIINNDLPRLRTVEIKQ